MMQFRSKQDAQGGRKAAHSVLLTCIILVGGISFVRAEAMTAKEAKSQVLAEIEESNDAVLAAYPALKDIALVIATDCAAKIPNQTATGEYCRCASSVTMSAWRAGGDGGVMLRKLKDYIAKPSPEAAAEFVKYQGPELYRPLCDLALGSDNGKS